MAARDNATRGGRDEVRWMVDVDPVSGELLVDNNGQPVMLRHYTAVEASPYLGVKPHTIRQKVRAREWLGRILPNGRIYLTVRHMADAVHKMDGSYRGAFDWPDDLTMGVRGLVLPTPDEDQEGAR